MKPSIAVLLVASGSIMLAFSIGAAFMNMPSSLDTRDVLVVVIGFAGAVLFGLGARETFRLAS